MCFEIMKAEVLVYVLGRVEGDPRAGSAGSAKHLSPSTRLGLLGSGRGGHLALPLWAPVHGRVRCTVVVGAATAIQPSHLEHTG